MKPAASHRTDSIPVRDSAMSLADALTGVDRTCPQEILAAQRLVDVRYFGFDDRIHQGQVVIHAELAADVEAIFALALELRFPIGSAIPIAAPQFRSGDAWSDALSMAANNSSGFNYRLVSGTTRLSNHAHGRAIDINPVQNPYIRGGVAQPPGAVRRPDQPGTFTAEHPLVAAFEERGWTWGGRWTEPQDYHHFQKIDSTR